MSGNATTIKTDRITSAEHSMLSFQIVKWLESKNIPYKFPTSLTGKTTHGDIDVVVAEDLWPHPAEFPEGVTGEQSRKGFTHVAWPVGDGRYVQVDFIRTPLWALEQTATYLSHGTLGNVIGLTCRSIGLRYKMTGLSRIMRHPDGTKFGDSDVCDADPITILLLLQLPAADIARILGGDFATREDYYPIPTHLPFFHTDCIHPERMTAPNRGRDKKRPEIVPYMNWLLANNIKQDWTLPWRENKEEYLAYQRKWQRRLLGESLMNGLIAEEHEKSFEARAKTGPKDAKGKWFKEFTPLADFVAITNPSSVVRGLVRQAGMTMDQYVEKVSPSEAIREYLYEQTKTTQTKIENDTE